MRKADFSFGGEDRWGPPTSRASAVVKKGRAFKAENRFAAAIQEIFW